MKRLIVTADDVGLHRGMTEGAIRAHKAGIVTACSIVATGRAFDDAVRYLRDVPSLETGIHLTLVEEASLTGVQLPKSYASFVPAFLTGRIGRGLIERELRAQFEKVRATGLRITHINSHQHLHMLPDIFAVVVRLAREFAIPYVRIVNDRGGLVGPVRWAAVSALSALGRRVRRKGLTNDFTIGVLQAGRIRDVVPLLDRVAEVTELVTHPGVAVDAYPHWKYDWEGETAALTAPALRDTIAARGIRLVAPSGAFAA